MLLDIKIKFSDRTIDQQLDYPNKDKVEITFNEVSQPISVDTITINGIDANIFYNTYYKLFDSQTTQGSVHNIDKPGMYTLMLDDLYIRSLRSNTWHCSEKERDFIHTYEFTRSSFVDYYRDRNHIGFDDYFIPCFGCSFTYGTGQPDTAAWPYLLAEKTGKNFLNLGTVSAGVDAIYNNMTLLHEQHPFDKCVILVPPFERRIVHTKIGDLNMRICSNVDLDSQKSNFHFYNDPGLRQQMESVNQKRFNDERNEYSMHYFEKMLDFCKAEKIDLYCSAWLKDEYEYLKQKDGFTLLPRFPPLDSFEEKADDGWHPHRTCYEYFTNEIVNFL